MNVLAISEQGVQNRNALSNGISSWQAFKAIEEDKRNIYLVMDQPGRIFMTHMIPKRFFESPTQAARFVERARGYWQQQAMQVVINRS
ncbi:MAG TPA: YcxB family protein [Ktedonobacteraceae bacterium]